MGCLVLPRTYPSGTSAPPPEAGASSARRSPSDFWGRPILSYPPALSCPTLSYPILSYPILSFPTLPILPYPTLSCPILSYPILSYPTLSYPILPFALLLQTGLAGLDGLAGAGCGFGVFGGCVLGVLGGFGGCVLGVLGRPGDQNPCMCLAGLAGATYGTSLETLEGAAGLAGLEGDQFGAFKTCSVMRCAGFRV